MPKPKPTLQDEVVNNIRNQAIGSHRVADLNLPEDYLRRMADRVLRTSFEREFRLVVSDRGGELDETAPSPVAIDSPRTTRTSTIRVIDHAESPETRKWRDSLAESRPAVRGFRAPMLDQREHLWPIAPPEGLTTAESAAADLVASRLAVDGLIPTLAAVIESIGSAADWSSAVSLKMLKAVGIPIDLLEFFHPPGEDHDQAILPWVGRMLQDVGRRPIDPVFRQARFAFRPTMPGFQVATESGEHDAAAIRLQWTCSNFWDGPGDGGNVDLTQQLLDHLPNTQVFIHIETRFLEQARTLIESWDEAKVDRITLIAEPRIVSQWAQDNGKPGITYGQRVTLVPRFASRGEDGTTFVPGDTFLMEAFHQAGEAVFQSPLLFQGGNLLPVRHPQSGERILLMGEAEVHRNMSLGLQRDQVMEAFGIEFGVDRCEVLPAVSFHIDYDLCVRAIGSKLVAFVNDDLAACRIILDCGLGAMVRHSLIDPITAEKAIRRLNRGDDLGFLEVIGPAIGAFVSANGHLTLSVAEKFSLSAVDSGVGNAHRFMFAMDMLTATCTAPAKLASIDPHGYFATLLRGQWETDGLTRALGKMGFQVVKVPSLSAGDRSVSTINGVHLKSAYLMPSTGGLFGPLDSAASAVFQAHLGREISVTAIRNGESQRRNGGVHCSVHVLPHLP